MCPPCRALAHLRLLPLQLAQAAVLAASLLLLRCSADAQLRARLALPLLLAALFQALAVVCVTRARGCACCARRGATFCASAPCTSSAPWRDKGAFHGPHAGPPEGVRAGRVWGGATAAGESAGQKRRQQRRLGQSCKRKWECG